MQWSLGAIWGMALTPWQDELGQVSVVKLFEDMDSRVSCSLLPLAA